jgi:hypothetical protein
VINPVTLQRGDDNSRMISISTTGWYCVSTSKKPQEKTFTPPAIYSMNIPGHRKSATNTAVLAAKLIPFNGKKRFIEKDRNGFIASINMASNLARLER